MPRLTADPWFDADDLEPFAPERHSDPVDNLDALSADVFMADTLPVHARAA